MRLVGTQSSGGGVRPDSDMHVRRRHTVGDVHGGTTRRFGSRRARACHESMSQDKPTSPDAQAIASTCLLWVESGRYEARRGPLRATINSAASAPLRKPTQDPPMPAKPQIRPTVQPT